MTKYIWTDWIKHTPGHELPSGLWCLFEFIGADPDRPGTEPYVPYQMEGVVTPDMRRHPTWHMTGDTGTHCRLVRYKIRVEAYEQEQEQEAELCK